MKSEQRGKLQGKVAIVTGSGRGIGRAIALRLAKEGAITVVNYRTNSQAADQTAKEIEAMGRRSLVVKANVANADEVNEMVQRVVQKFGKVDILVNNAGIVRVGPFLDFAEEDWDAIFNINVKGVFLCSKSVARQMIKQGGGGKIINISSLAGKAGGPNYAAYCASKFAVIGFTQSIAHELLPHKINVNAVCPGDVSTEMLEYEFKALERYLKKSSDEIRKERVSVIPMKKFANPEDVANLVSFLASSDSDYMTGQAVNIGGGLQMH